MKSMAVKMKESMEEKEQMEEDIKMLRQVLDNLWLFFDPGRCNGTI
jgi:hypothetical protein